MGVVCRGWRVEEDFHTAEGVCGLTQGQTTCWTFWMRRTLISMLADVLAVTRVRTTTATTGSELAPPSSRNCSNP